MLPKHSLDVKIPNPFTHLKGSLVRVIPLRWRNDFKSLGIAQASFTALLVNTTEVQMTVSDEESPSGTVTFYDSCILYEGTLYKVSLLKEEIYPFFSHENLS